MYVRTLFKCTYIGIIRICMYSFITIGLQPLVMSPFICLFVFVSLIPQFVARGQPSQNYIFPSFEILRLKLDLATNMNIFIFYDTRKDIPPTLKLYGDFRRRGKVPSRFITSSFLSYSW